MAGPQLGYQQQMQGSTQGQQMQGHRGQAYPGQSLPGMIGRMSGPTSILSQQQGGQPPQQPGGGPVQQQKEVNTASLCRLGQETVQDIVNKTTDLFQLLKQAQLPTGTQQSITMQKERKEKTQEHLSNISLLFRRIRLIYDKCNENCAGMEYTHIESLIPVKDEVDSRPEERKLTEMMKYVNEEHREIAEQVIQRSRHLKEIIDHLRNIIWEMTTMLATRRP